VNEYPQGDCDTYSVALWNLNAPALRQQGSVLGVPPATLIFQIINPGNWYTGSMPVYVPK
jgi:hypothetical protein